MSGDHKVDKGLRLSREQLEGLFQLLEKADIASFTYEDADVKFKIVRRVEGEMGRAPEPPANARK